MTKFIVIEGADGSGKTTQVEELKKIYTDALFLREPGSTKVGEKLRSVLLDHLESLHPKTQLYLMHTARWQNVTENIKPALEKGQTVICDRFLLSTFAYQVFPSKEDLIGDITGMHEEFVEYGIDPYYIFLDLPLDVSIERIASRKDRNVFDEKDMEFQKLIHMGYDEGIKKLQLKHKRIDANRSVEEILLDIKEEIDKC